MNQLPIEVIPNTSPPKFKWRTHTGQELTGSLPASVEWAVQELIKRVMDLEKRCEAAYERIASQADQLSTNAERRR